MNIDTKYLDNFETKLQNDLVRLCTSYNQLDGILLASDDLSNHWHNLLAPEYVADAVEQIQDYPIVSVAWASYLGMAVAYAWDTDWATFSKAPYQAFYGERGFDDMDEHIVRDLLEIPLDSEEAKELEAMIRRCGEAAVSHIRHEEIEPQSPMAFHLFARAVKVMFHIGAALQLKRLGYKLEKVELPN
ncbi:MAG: hypothetical protein WCR36_08940 [Bacteroidaceae bacterium]